MSVWAVLLVHAQPDLAKIFCRSTPPRLPDSDPGMWSTVLESHGTTSNRVRSNVAGKAGLSTVFLPLPVVGAMPLISLRTIGPCVSHPNVFCIPPGVQTTPLVTVAEHLTVNVVLPGVSQSPASLTATLVGERWMTTLTAA